MECTNQTLYSWAAKPGTGIGERVVLFVDVSGIKVDPI